MSKGTLIITLDDDLTRRVEFETFVIFPSFSTYLSSNTPTEIISNNDGRFVLVVTDALYFPQYNAIFVPDSTDLTDFTDDYYDVTYVNKKLTIDKQNYTPYFTNLPVIFNERLKVKLKKVYLLQDTDKNVHGFFVLLTGKWL